LPEIKHLINYILLKHFKNTRQTDLTMEFSQSEIVNLA